MALPSALRRRFVEDEDGCVGLDAVGDFDELALGDRKRRDQGLRIEIERERPQCLSCRLVHPGIVDAAEAAGGLVAQKHVLGNGEVGQQRHFLEDSGYAGGQCFARIGEEDLLAGLANFPQIGSMHARQNLHQRRFASAILAHQGVDRSGFESQRNAIHGKVAAERLHDVVHFN
jgi:hypothetical protein